MALIGNYSTVNKTPGRLFGGLEAQHRSNWTKSNSFQNFAYQSESGTVLRYVSVPPGVYPPYTWDLPIYRGAITSHNEIAGFGDITSAGLAGGVNITSDISGVANTAADIAGVGLITATIAGTGDVSSALLIGAVGAEATIAGTSTVSAELSLLVSFLADLAGTSTVEADLLMAPLSAWATADIAGTSGVVADLNATADIASSISGSGDITGADLIGAWFIVAPIEGTSTVTAYADALGNISATVPGSVEISADMRALGSIACDITPFTELSPQNLAAELWNSLAASYQSDGTMGAKLNAAGSAGDPWTGNIEGVLTAKDAMRILLSVAAGNTVITDNGNGTAIVEFKSRDGATSRVSATMDGSERVNVIIDTV